MAQRDRSKALGVPPIHARDTHRKALGRSVSFFQAVSVAPKKLKKAK